MEGKVGREGGREGGRRGRGREGGVCLQVVAKELDEVAARVPHIRRNSVLRLEHLS